MADKKIRIGVIGCGQFMSRQHIQTIARSESLCLEHLADQDTDKLRQIADLYHPYKTTSRWQDVIENPQVDIVVAGIVPSYHPEIAKAAIQHGKPVYIEKPLTENLAQGLEIQRLAQQTGVPIAVGFNRRFAPAVEAINHRLADHRGPMTLLYRVCDDDRVRPPEQNWKKQDRLLIEIVHIFDLLCYLTRSEPTRVYGVESRYNDALITLDFADGSHAAILSSSWGSLAQPKEHFEAVLNRETLEMDDFVELRIFGDTRDCPQKLCFAGRPYDRCDNSHVENFRRDGLQALTDMRCRYHHALCDAGVLQNSADSDAWRKFQNLIGDPPLPQINYAPDKGWGTALEEFCVNAKARKPVRNASAVHGNRASAIALAARKSIQSQAPVPLTSSDWQL